MHNIGSNNSIEKQLYQMAVQKRVKVKMILKENRGFTKPIVYQSHSYRKFNNNLNEIANKLGLSWAKLSQSWGLKLELKVEV